MKLVNIVGQKFNRLLVISRAPKVGRRPAWLCICECGKEYMILGESLKSGRVTSCGCRRRELALQRTTHGLSDSSTHNSWTSMKGRCLNTKNKKYPNYGGRGIMVCGRWLKFENFLADMGEKPTPKHSIDRINVDQGYSPENCRWGTRTQQSRNKTNSKIIETPNGPMQICDAADFFKIPLGRLRSRIYENDIAPERWFELDLRQTRKERRVRSGIGNSSDPDKSENPT